VFNWTLEDAATSMGATPIQVFFKITIPLARPGIMARMGLDYESVKAINPGIVYGTVTGYGTKGPWVEKPGQDLLAQSMSGVAFLNGNASDPPVALGLSLADSITGTHLAQGLLACLVRRTKTGLGGQVEVSLLESMLDLQFEQFSYYLNNDRKLPERSTIGNANDYLGAPCWRSLPSGSADILQAGN